MTVQSLLSNMTQKEICHWMAYYKIKGDDDKEGEKELTKPQPKQDQQAKNDQDLMSHLFALAGRKE